MPTTTATIVSPKATPKGQPHALPALTSPAAAALALKCDLTLVPAYGTCRPDGAEFDVEFEAPILHSDALTMTAAANDSLSARVLQTPGQGYWLLCRWRGA